MSGGVDVLPSCHSFCCCVSDFCFIAAFGINSLALTAKTGEKAEFDTLKNLIKEVLGDRIHQVVISSDLADTPCALKNSEPSYCVPNKTMELNSTHSIIHELKKKASADKTDKTVKDWIWLLFGTALIRHRGSWRVMDSFCKLDLIKRGWSVSKRIKEQALTAEFEPLMKLMKEALGDKVEQAVISSGLADAPCAVTSCECG